MLTLGVEFILFVFNYIRTINDIQSKFVDLLISFIECFKVIEPSLVNLLLIEVSISTVL